MISTDKALEQFKRKQTVVVILGLVILCGLSIIFNHIYLSGQAEQTGRFISHLVQIKEMREVTNILKDAQMDQFNVINYNSAKDNAHFTLPEMAELFPDKSLWHWLSTDRVTVNTRSPDHFGNDAQVTFEFSRFASIKYAVLLWLALVLVSLPQTHFMRKKVVSQFEKDLTLERESIKAELARMVRHDIRTPLAALIRLSDTVRGLTRGEVELFQNIIGQIRFLVSQLDNDKPVRENLEKIPIYDCIRDSFRELKLVMPSHVELDLELEDSILSANVRFIYHELRSLIANVCSNSKDAMIENGKIVISAEDLGHEVIIRVRDTGRGISPDILPRVTEKGFSRGKEGTGYGLFLADQSMKAWGGGLKITSSLGVGTTVSLHFPIIDREQWFVPRIKLRSGDAVVVVDDQTSVHQIWQMRLNDVGFVGPRLFFKSGEEAISANALEGLNPEKIHVFMDHDLGTSRQTGLEVFSHHFMAAHRYLVTGRFDDVDLRNGCGDKKLGLIPKTELATVPIIVR